MGNENSEITFPIESNNHYNKIKINSKKIKNRDILNKPNDPKNKNQKNPKILKGYIIPRISATPDRNINLQTVLSSLRLNKEDIKNNEKLEIFLQKKAKDTGDFLPTEFNPLTYKIYKCPLGPICKLDKKLCLNYHGNADKRRNPNFYQAKLCPNLYENNKRKKDAKCNLNEECDCAHNLFEYYYHPEKFRTIKCPHEKKENTYCKERLICPYYHEGDSDCGKDGVRMMLNEKLITDYYRSLMISYENSIDDENVKLNEIEKKYLCYKCGDKNSSALKEDGFLVDKNENRIVCSRCASNPKNNIEYVDVGW